MIVHVLYFRPASSCAGCSEACAQERPKKQHRRSMVHASPSPSSVHHAIHADHLDVLVIVSSYIRICLLASTSKKRFFFQMTHKGFLRATWLATRTAAHTKGSTKIAILRASAHENRIFEYECLSFSHENGKSKKKFQNTKT